MQISENHKTSPFCACVLQQSAATFAGNRGLSEPASPPSLRDLPWPAVPSIYGRRLAPCGVSTSVFLLCDDSSACLLAAPVVVVSSGLSQREPLPVFLHSARSALVGLLAARASTRRSALGTLDASVASGSASSLGVLLSACSDPRFLKLSCKLSLSPLGYRSFNA